MGADPEPDEDTIFFDAHGTPPETYAHRVNVQTFMDFLELEGRMLGVLHP